MLIRMNLKEIMMIKICTQCHHEYKRTYCDFCKRKARWRLDKYLKEFTPRLQSDLKKIKIKVLESDLKKGLFVTGIIGCGKSLYAANVMLASIRNTYIYQEGPKTHSFITVPDLLDNIRQTYKEPESEIDLVKFYSQVDFLVLDDLGVEKITDWTLEKLFQIINYRYEYLKLTVFTSNLSLKELAEQIGDRIPSRIKQMTSTKKLKDIDYRLQK